MGGEGGQDATTAYYSTHLRAVGNQSENENENENENESENE